MAAEILRQSKPPDPFRVGLASGWKVIDASMLAEDRTIEADVAIVGTGAGGGTAAEILANAGLNVVMIEEGPLATSSDFQMRESEAYPELYQESAARKTKDKAINILQGRCVGGGTTVNWTSIFRTPLSTLEYWAREFGLEGFSAADLAPWFEQREQRQNAISWPVVPNENNDALRRGVQALGFSVGAIRRNVKGCWNIGYCGMGCPTNAKQSMLVTTIPGALARGATLLTRTRAWKFEHANGRVSSLECLGLDAHGTDPTLRRIRIRAKTFIAAGGAIGTPALLKRSKTPDPNGIVGKRTFLHPSLVSAALMPERIDGFSGAPQTIYSDQFLEPGSPDGPIGFKLEAAPLHPVLGSTTLAGFGQAHARWMHALPYAHCAIALMRDGFHRESPGGSVELRSDGTPVLDYPLNDYLLEGARRALATMAEIQFAAGAKEVMPVRPAGLSYTSWRDAREAIAALPLGPSTATVVSAHVMGGCPLGPDPRRAVVDPSGRYRELENLYVVDGSIFPTSIGANPQLSIYAIAAKLASGLAQKLKVPS
ncbi:MAG TPA: GMC family oxidoreductase [Casimicrobiaceae bacterium]|jgi:choline dehydrogenase-like flavoprotein|nr:GMC family oxidoreductase [Casimicrobiaceae bacterium]